MRTSQKATQDIHRINLVILINLRDNRYRCLDLTDPRSTTGVRTTSNVGACPVVPPSHCGYRQGEPSPYLVSRVLLVELDFRGFGNSRSQRSRAKHTGTLVVPSLSSRRNTSRGHRWVARLLPLRTTVVHNPMAARQSQPRVEYKDYSLIAHT